MHKNKEIKEVIKWRQYIALADLKGGQGRPPRVQILSFLCSFRKKIDKIIPIWESWIRHCIARDVLSSVDVDYYLVYIATSTLRWVSSTVVQSWIPCRNFSNFSLIRGILQWWSMRKCILKHTQMTNIFDIKIILHNYILNNESLALSKFFLLS